MANNSETPKPAKPVSVVTDGKSEVRKGEKPSAPSNFTLPKPVKIPLPPGEPEKKK